MKTSLIASLVLASLTSALASTSARAETPAAASTVRLDSTLRFRNAPVVTAVRDPHLLPRPEERPFLRSAYFFDAYIGKRSVRALASDPSGRAGAVNALDEVPDSSWFENRVGVRPVAPEELRERPVAAPRAPFTVFGMKEGGTSLGVRLRDADGAGYVVKFGNFVGNPTAEVSADIVLQRLLWTAGYHTAEDTIVDFRKEDIRLDPKATVKDPSGASRPMTPADLKRAFARALPRANGRFRGLFSRFLDGVPVGGYPQEGVRADDPNDTVPHEDRRDVRGARVFFAWLNHVDVKEDNVLDTWIEDKRTPGQGQIRHYLVDFGSSLGVFGWPKDHSAGFAQLWDFKQGARALVSFGLWKRPWEGMEPANLPGVGNLESTRFDPTTWQAQYPWAPFERFDRFDGAWGARISCA